MGSTVGLANVMNIATIAVSAIIMALTGFMFLHSRKQVDFYHSIPIRRELLFAVKYLDGILIVVSMYLLNMVLAIGVLAINGIELSTLIPVSLTTFAVHVGGFLINYGLMVIAVMLTGNFFISILGGIVLFAYIPAAIALVQGLMYLFFSTINTRGISMETWMINGSPISYYINMVVEGSGMELEKYGTLLDSVGIAGIVGLIMAVIALFLYTKRPSESAGKSMAFKITKMPIKILLVVPITIAAAILFWNIYYSLPWAVFGFIIGLVVTHAIVEIIYHFEFRKLFANLPHMGVSAVLALAVIAVFRFDLVGYDTYKPEESKFKGASIYVSNFNDWNDYGLPYQYGSGSGMHQSWRYMSGDEYAANNMSVTDYDIVSRIADAGISDAQWAKEYRYSGEDIVRDEGFWTTMEIGYQLQNGKTVYRNYHVNVTELLDVFEALYTTAEYKNGINPVLSYDIDNISGIYEAKRSEIQEVNADKALQEKLLNTYKEEMIALTLEERANETPVTSLRFLTLAEYEYLTYVSHGRSVNFTGDFRIEDMNNVNFFPVYPSFTKTLELLKEAGIDDFGPVDVDDVERMEIYSDYYTDELAYYDAVGNYYEDQVYAHGIVESTYAVPVASNEGIRTIDLKDDGTAEMRALMQEVLDVAVSHELAVMNGLQGIEYGITVRVYMKEDNEGRREADQEFVPYVFAPDEIPQFIKDAYEYETRESKNVNYGLNFSAEK
ncbi:MAG: hypothetical protein IJ374_03650 [Lachnospiraceae bacterium]|nr:hypothetical protein [Lachnospiraceae bacterium]